MDRGGGSDDYDKANPRKDLMLIQCGIGKPNTVTFEWKLQREYVLTVERGEQVELPAQTVTIDDRNYRAPARTLWEWYFTMRPVNPEKGEPTFRSLIYDSADGIGSFCVWNESGYGSTGDEQHARWSLPRYRTDDNKVRVARKWYRD